MASYTVERAKTATLVASTADTVTFEHGYPRIEVVHQGSSGVVYVRTDGTAATVAGDDCYVVMPGDAVYVPTGPTPAEISVISASAVTYTVTGVRK